MEQLIDIKICKDKVNEYRLNIGIAEEIETEKLRKQVCKFSEMLLKNLTMELINLHINNNISLLEVDNNNDKISLYSPYLIFVRNIKELNKEAVKMLSLIK